MKETPVPKPPVGALASWHPVKQLGRSGQSFAWQVKHKVSGVMGALKVSHLTPAQRARLQREIQILSRIEHPALVAPLDADASAEEPWLVTPFGTPLGKWWPKFCAEHSTEERFHSAARFVLQLASGLAAVHREGIVHRDLKPENVIILDERAQPRPVLIDFGVAYIRNEQRLTQLDGRPVRNAFVSHPESHYRVLDEPPPWWDCLGLAWIWAWMLGDMPLSERPRFHWKYHPLIQHPKSPLFHALLAACNSESVGPANGADFIMLAERLGLGEGDMAPTDRATDAFEAARLAAAIATADHERQKAERVEAVEASAELLGAIYDRIYGELEELFKVAGLPLQLERIWNETSAATLMRLGADDEERVLLFQITGSRPSGDFEIKLVVTYKPFPADLKILPFVFTLKAMNTFDISWNSVAHRRDGSPVLAESLSSLPETHIVHAIRDHLAQQAVWNPTF